jgi:pimeloyl-ACP methyl ester carboxylesterase
VRLPHVSLPIVALAVALSTVGCSPTPPPSAPASNAATGDGQSIAAFAPTYADVACPSDVVAVVVQLPTCGYLSVLEDRSKPAGRTIKVFVVRFGPPGGTTTPDPMLGVGESLGAQVEYGGSAPGAARTHRNVYIVDLRGIGHSEPNLDCPEVRAVGPTLAGIRLRDPAHQSTLRSAVAACHDRLVGQGIDPAAYDLRSNAADLEDLRIALGLPSWNISANGSSSRILFELAAQDRAAIRTLIADSPAPPSPDAISIGPAALEAAIGHLALACSRDVACARTTPDVRVMIEEAVRKLDAAPVTVEVAGTEAAKQIGHTISVVIDGATLLRYIRMTLASGGADHAGDAINGALRVLDNRVTATDPIALAIAADPGDCLGFVPGCERMTFGALYSIECRDILPFVDRDMLTEGIAGRATWSELFAPEVALAPCAAWPVEPAARFQTVDPTNGVRSLFLRGQLDPFTVPLAELARSVDGTDVSIVDVPNQSYNVLGFTECPRAIRNPWLDATSGPPVDTSCLNTIVPVRLAP